MRPRRSKGNDAKRVDRVAPNTLPAWFTKNRVHGHTRLTLSRWHDTPYFHRAPAGFKSFGAHAFTRHVKTGDDDPWWPSGQPPGPNVVKAFIDRAHDEGLRIFAYYWHMSQKSEADAHPDWICKEFDGTPISSGRGLHLDITGQYREVVLTHLRELAAMGADGLFFDARHLPPRGCWETALAHAWETQTGAPPPSIDYSNVVYRRFLDFKAEKIAETFIYWRDQVKAEHPNIVFIVSTTTIPALTDREMTTRLARLADSAKNEYRHALSRIYSKRVFDDVDLKRPNDHVRQALGWTVLRDAADGRPPHIWARGLPNSDHAQAFAGSLLTFGCIANMDVYEGNVGGGGRVPAGKTPVAALKDAFALGNAASPHMAKTQLLKWAAVHFSERIRNARCNNFRAAWQDVLWPLVGAYQVLTEDGAPVGIVNDDQLEHGGLNGYRLVVLPNPNELSTGQAHAVAQFRLNGGSVIENNPAWPWSDPNSGEAAATAFRTVIQGHTRAAPVRVTGGPKGRYGVAYHSNGRLVVAVTNDFSWVQIRWTANTINPAPPAATGVRVTWRKGQGLPQVPNPPGQLRAVEAITGRELSVEESASAYTVSLPRFRFMALLVVTREPGVPARRGG
jgi:hypothetical protein